MSVFEHQRLRVDDFAQASDFAWLMAQELAVFTLKRQRRQWQLNVGHYIGIVMLPSGITLEILPKPIASAQIDNAVPADSLRQTRQWLQGMLTDLRIPENRVARPSSERKCGAMKKYGASHSLCEDEPSIRHVFGFRGNRCNKMLCSKGGPETK